MTHSGCGCTGLKFCHNKTIAMLELWNVQGGDGLGEDLFLLSCGGRCLLLTECSLKGSLLLLLMKLFPCW